MVEYTNELIMQITARGSEWTVSQAGIMDYIKATVSLKKDLTPEQIKDNCVSAVLSIHIDNRRSDVDY